MAETIGEFEVLGTLGKGAHSIIMHIRRHEDSREYALKVVKIASPEDQRFLVQAEHEFAIAEQLAHENLVKVHCLEKTRAWLIGPVREARLLIEYINGMTLDRLKVMSPVKWVQIFEQVAAGLAHMHEHDIYHADLKPGNIMLSKAGKVKILDFGLARIGGQGKDRVQGTPEYLAPEQASHGMVNERTDVFNFGATMYRLCAWTNVPSVVEDGVLVPPVMWQRLLKPVGSINTQVPKQLAGLIHRCLQHNAHLRPEHAGEVHELLREIREKLVKEPQDRLVEE